LNRLRITTGACAVAAIAGMLAVLNAQQSAAGRSRPNILIIVADDLGYGDIAAFNFVAETDAAVWRGSAGTGRVESGG
jgi:hypothetical protein